MVIQDLDRAAYFLDSFLSDLNELPLREKINIDDNGKATTIIDEKIEPLTLDAKQTIYMAKKLYQRVQSIPRKAVNSSFLKYFRLISENARKISKKMIQLLSDSSWFSILARPVLKKGATAINLFINSINGVFDEINDCIPDRNYQITKVPEHKWNIIKATQLEREERQQKIRLRDYVPPSQLI